GIGIPEDRLGDIFEPFRQVENSYTRSYQGAGLGLSIVHRLVSLMDGTITIKSTPGAGTTVHVILPLQKLQNDSSIAASASPGDTGGGLRVLLVEDDPTSRGFLRAAGIGGALTEHRRGGRGLLRLLALPLRALLFLLLQTFVALLFDDLGPVRHIETGDGQQAAKAAQNQHHNPQRAARIPPQRPRQQHAQKAPRHAGIGRGLIAGL
ncbi:MAG: hypothetical protein EOM69_09810, partial [Clostridia bacterium]|nr:hypothetical protein [Clostridia bacterium]